MKKNIKFIAMSNLNSLINITYQNVLSDQYGISCSSDIALAHIEYQYLECDGCTEPEEICIFSISPITFTCTFSIEEL